MASYNRKTKDVNISPKLTIILEKIAHKSEVARLLLKSKLSKEDLVEDPIDYLSVSKEDPSKISYAYSEKLAKLHPDDFWSFKGRVHAKPAAAIKKFLKDVSEKDLDIFTSAYKAATSFKEFELSIVSGEEIKKYYHHKSYNEENGGTLHNSCMKHEGCSDFFQIYIDNPDVCKMLVMLDQRGKLLGRALIWKAINAETNTEINVMDRIYAVDDAKNMHYFKEWADENGYIHKKEQKWQNCLHFESHGVTKIYKIKIPLKKSVYFRYPYIDTFKFWNEKESLLSNFLPEKDNGYVRTMIGNDGRTFGADVLALDIVQNQYIHRDHLVYLPYIDGRTHSDFTIWSETMEQSIARDHAIYSEEVQDYIFIEAYDKHNNKERIKERKEQIRKMKERQAQKMVASKKARLSTSSLYEMDMDDDFFTFLGRETIIANPPVQNPVAEIEVNIPTDGTATIDPYLYRATTSTNRNRGSRRATGLPHYTSFTHTPSVTGNMGSQGVSGISDVSDVSGNINVDNNGNIHFTDTNGNINDIQRQQGESILDYANRITNMFPDTTIEGQPVVTTLAAGHVATVVDVPVPQPTNNIESSYTRYSRMARQRGNRWRI